MAGELNKLSDKRLRNLQGTPRQKIEFFADGAGLSAKLSKVGGISWVFTYRLVGAKLHRLTLGNYPDMSLKQARDSRDKCRSWLADGKDPKMQFNLTMEASLKPVTVKDALQYWITEYATDNRANVERHKAQLEKHIYPYIGGMALSDCETRYWLKCFDRIKRESPVAAGYIFQMCKQALKFCRVRRYAVSNHLDDLTIPDVGKKQQKRDRVLTDSEIGQLWNFSNSDELFSSYYSSLLVILIVFGCRSQEARLSEWKEWDLEQWLWTVPKEHSKSGEKIIRPVPVQLREFITELSSHNKQSGYLLGLVKKSEAVSQTGRNMHKRLNHAEPWTLHDLRRSFATKLNELGIAPHVVEQLLGHTMPGVMAIYNRSQYLPEKLDALNKWINRLEVLAGNHENVILLKAGGK
ncbi:tyrosine-type recombinase/integrase [Serratia ureilytica]|uniref:tyrosine-type recombinase/integrase n=1 Tax=Serratia ureilytica TaxID=300181 RepID=UPI0018E7E455|nr:site-specific integrase [Serratia ureilytica]MBJ2092083.1 tyrosine-type recombinase/integrase [Serratia ureilytica]